MLIWTWVDGGVMWTLTAIISNSLAAAQSSEALKHVAFWPFLSLGGSGEKAGALKFRLEGAQTKHRMDSDGTNLTFHLCKTLWEVYGDLLFQEQKDIYLQMQGNKFQVHLVLENGCFIADFNPLDFLLNLPLFHLELNHTLHTPF